MDLSKVKLRPTQTKAVSSVLQQQQIICGDSQDYYRLMKETYLEEYLDILWDITFASMLIPLTVDDCALLVELHNSKNKGDNNNKNNVKKELEDKVDAVMQEKGWKTIFVRLSSRSPKDAALSQGNFQTLLRKHYAQIKKEGHLNEKLRAIYSASTEAMACTSGSEAVSMLVRSERIQEDLRGVKVGDAFNLVVRQFVSFLPELEVRVFVWGGRLTAITQYNQLICSLELQQHKQSVLEAVEKLFVDILSKRIKLPNYVVDVIVISDDKEHSNWKNLRAWVVELNPLAEFTGMGLFDWQNLHDRDIICGRAPMEFRIAEKAPTLVQGDIAPDYAVVLNTLSNWEQ